MKNSTSLLPRRCVGSHALRWAFANCRKHRVIDPGEQLGRSREHLHNKHVLTRRLANAAATGSRRNILERWYEVDAVMFTTRGRPGPRHAQHLFEGGRGTVQPMEKLLPPLAGLQGSGRHGAIAHLSQWGWLACVMRSATWNARIRTKPSKHCWQQQCEPLLPWARSVLPCRRGRTSEGRPWTSRGSWSSKPQLDLTSEPLHTLAPSNTGGNFGWWGAQGLPGQCPPEILESISMQAPRPSEESCAHKPHRPRPSEDQARRVTRRLLS